MIGLTWLNIKDLETNLALQQGEAALAGIQVLEQLQSIILVIEEEVVAGFVAILHLLVLDILGAILVKDVPDCVLRIDALFVLVFARESLVAVLRESMHFEGERCGLLFHHLDEERRVVAVVQTIV